VLIGVPGGSLYVILVEGFVYSSVSSGATRGFRPVSPNERRLASRAMACRYGSWSRSVNVA